MNISSILLERGQNPQRKAFPLKESKGSFGKVFNETKKNLELEKLRKAAHDLEAILINQMIKAMRKTLNREDDPLYGGHAEDIFQEMLDQKYSEMISNSFNMGLATQIYNQMLKYVK